MGAPKPNYELTSTAKRLLQLYQAHIKDHRVAPSVRWLARELDVYPFAVRYHLKRLEAAGLLEQSEKKVITVRLRLSAKGRRAL